MGQRINDFQDGSYLEYDKGKFDDWCVYLVTPNGTRTAPLDTDNFRQLKHYAEKYGADALYRDFVQIYDLTGTTLEANVLRQISTLSARYRGDETGIAILFTILYTAMVSEENKAHTRLGKRIKRLGVHKLLIENCTVDNSANSMRGSTWREIDSLCRARGF